jgi:predicted SprT family Zn-dependent metalloprotease
MSLHKEIFGIRNQLVQQWIKYACTCCNRQYLLSRIKVEWSNRMTSCAGLAYVESKIIRLSIPLWEHATLKQRRWVVIHEVCHLFCLPKIQHSDPWKQKMIQCGEEPNTCHDIPTE